MQACGDKTYAATGAAQSPNTGSLSSSEMTIDSNTGFISIDITDASKIGYVYTVTVTASLNKSPTITGTVSFDITIEACKVTSLAFPSVVT